MTAFSNQLIIKQCIAPVGGIFPALTMRKKKQIYENRVTSTRT